LVHRQEHCRQLDERQDMSGGGHDHLVGARANNCEKLWQDRHRICGMEGYCTGSKSMAKSWKRLRKENCVLYDHLTRTHSSNCEGLRQETHRAWSTGACCTGKRKAWRWSFNKIREVNRLPYDGFFMLSRWVIVHETKGLWFMRQAHGTGRSGLWFIE